jgi:excisionase family DNA binding protein
MAMVITERAALTVTEVALQVGMHRNSILAAIRRGEIPSIRIGKRIRIPKQHMERLLEGSLPKVA